jgi:hypothetical protein
MKDFIRGIYWYFTDFCINAANLLGITYVEFNFWLFIILFPSTLILLIVLNIFKSRFLKRIKT